MLTAAASGTSALPGIVDVGLPRLRELRTGLVQDLHRDPVVQRQDVVAAGLDPPDVDELLEPVRVLIGEVMGFRAIYVRVVQFPYVLVEVAPVRRGGCRVTAFHPWCQMPRVPSIS